MDFKTAVAIPCYNEEASIAKVVKDFQKALPGALISPPGSLKRL